MNTLSNTSQRVQPLTGIAASPDRRLAVQRLTEPAAAKLAQSIS